MAGGDSDQLPTGSFRLVGEQVDELAPSGVVDGSVQAGFGSDVAAGGFKGASGGAGHVGDAEVFDGDEVVGGDEAGGELVGLTAALLAYLFVETGDPAVGPPAAVGALLGGRDGSLGPF